MQKRKDKPWNKEGLIAVILFFFVWEIAFRLQLVNPLFISSPLEVLIAGKKLIFSGIITPYFFGSLKVLSVGLLGAIVVGFVGGVIIGASPKVKGVSHPFIYALSAMPMIAVMPLLILWLGIGVSSKIAIVFLLSLMPILINTIDGVLQTDKKLIHMTKSFQGGRLILLREVYLWSALPYAFSGIRTAIGRSIIGVVIADFFGSATGLGYLIVVYGGSFQTARVMFILGLLLAVSLTLTWIVGIIEKKLIIKN